MTNKSGQIKEQALVLRTIRHGDTSRIATLFGPELGKIAVLAKGARSGKSGATGGALDVPTLVEAIVHFKASRSVQILGQTTVIESFPGIKEDVEKTAYAAVISELVIKGFTDDEVNATGYSVALQAMHRIDKSSSSHRFILLEFLYSLADALGFAIEPVGCPECGVTPAKIGVNNKFLFESGAICCSSCNPTNFEYGTVSGESAGILRLLKHGGFQRDRLRVTVTAQKELISLLIRHLRYHHESYHHLPSLEMLGQLAND